MRACWDQASVHRPTAKDTSERCYYGSTPRSEASSRTGVRISIVVEEVHVEYVLVTGPDLGAPGPSKIPAYPGERKREIARSPMKLPRKF